jgi:nucleoside 2-deoxyribosyltransferase
MWVTIQEQSSTMKRVYLASPLGFAGSTRRFMQELEQALSAHVAIDNPWRFEAVAAEEFAQADRLRDREEHRFAHHALNHRIAAANDEAIRSADWLIGVLDGVDVDSGTAAEIGYAFALGKRIWGLRTDFRTTGDNAGSTVNLQVQYFIEASGGSVETTIEGLLRELKTWVDAV